MIGMIAAACAGATAWLVVPGGRALELLRCGPGTTPGSAPVVPRGAAVVAGALASTGTALVLLSLVDPVTVLPLGVIAGAVWWANREVRAAATRRRVSAEQARVAEFAAALAVELRTGRPARRAVVAALTTVGSGGWTAAARSAAEGGLDLAAALRRESSRPGAGGLRDLAACWQVAERTGAGLAASLEVLSAAATRRAAHRARIRAELAGIRATGWLLAGLPLLAAVLGAAAGARPWEVLVGTPAGAVLLAVGTGLEVLGLAWLRRMTRGAESVSAE